MEGWERNNGSNCVRMGREGRRERRREGKRKKGVCATGMKHRFYIIN